MVHLARGKVLWLHESRFNLAEGLGQVEGRETSSGGGPQSIGRKGLELMKGEGTRYASPGGQNQDHLPAGADSLGPTGVG